MKRKKAWKTKNLTAVQRAIELAWVATIDTKRNVRNSVLAI